MSATPLRFALSTLLAAAACAPATRPAAEPTPDAGLPSIPGADGPLAIRVVHPTPETPLPDVDSTFVFGSVGSGRASLAIDGIPVPVAPNGAFLAYLPVPDSGSYRLIAERGGDRVEARAGYRLPPPVSPSADTTTTPPAAPVRTEALPRPLAARVSGGADTLATGSDVAIGRPTPTGTYRWFLPRGAVLVVDARRGDQLRVRLDSATMAWFDAEDLTLGGVAPRQTAPVGPVTIEPAAEWTDVRIPTGAAPFRVEPGDTTLALTLYDVGTPTPLPVAPSDGPVHTLSWDAAAGKSARLVLGLRAPLWGYKAFYEPDGTLVLRVRRPPALDPERPLAGLRVAVDAGHPPGGATGPTGLTEAETNLAIALRLADRLRAAGAEVILPRTDSAAVGLADRPRAAVAADAHLLISVHNNAFPEGVNPFRENGTSTYYFHPFSAGLAEALDREIVATTRLRDLGAKQGNLALVRPTWMPSVLTESLFLMLPEQEAALRDPAFLDRLADAHLRGIEAFARERAGRTP